MSQAKSDERWVWMDLEMTGLDDKTCTILQIATVVTDSDLNELASLDIPIWQPDSALESMSPFVRKMHTENGLLERVRRSEVSMAEAESRTLDMLVREVPFQKGILAGNSIWQDRRFLLRYMPHIEHYLHYRQIDVSTLKVLVGSWSAQKGLPPKKASTHTALEDIRASIEELRFYREHSFIPFSHDIL